MRWETLKVGSKLRAILHAVALVATEVFLTKGHMLAEAEIAIGCAPCGASMALATQKYIWVRN